MYKGETKSFHFIGLKMEGAGRGSRETPEHPLHPPLSLFEI